MVHNEDITKNLWGEAANTACHILNIVYFRPRKKKQKQKQKQKNKKNKNKNKNLLDSQSWLVFENKPRFDKSEESH